MSLYRPFLGDANAYIHLWGANLCQSYLRAPNLIDLTKTGLVSAYDFKDESLEDLKGSKDGTATGTLTFSQSRQGTFVRFGGDSYIDLGAWDVSSGSLFISFYYKHETTPTGRYICGLFETALNRFGIAVAADTMSIYDDLCDANYSGLYSKTLTNGKIYHVVAGITSANVLKMWVDGEPSANNRTALSGISAMSAHFYIGSLYYLNTISILGSIANVEIFNTDQTDADAAEIYARGKIDTDLGPFVEIDTLGAGVSIEAPIYELSDADMLRPLNGGRIALSFDIDFPALPQAESTVETDYPVLTLYKDADEYIEIYLQRESESIA